jgi:ASCH domain
MKVLSAISIRQPWLDLILKGKKRLELRDWNVKFRGTIALHSPMGIDFHAANYFGYHEPWKLERGKILGIADVTDAKELDEAAYNASLTEHLSVFPFPGLVYSLSLSDIFVLPAPVTAKGKLLIFPLEEIISNKIIIQLPTNRIIN